MSENHEIISDIADVPAVEVVGRYFIELLNLAAVHCGLSEDGRPADLDEARKYIDAAAGMWCTNAGHGRTQISEAIAKMAATLDYAPPFQFGIPQAFELASRIAELAPKGLDAAGRVATYGQIAAASGRPGAARAVGNIMRDCGRPDVPCHRVIAAGEARHRIRHRLDRADEELVDADRQQGRAPRAGHRAAGAVQRGLSIGASIADPPATSLRQLGRCGS